MDTFVALAIAVVFLAWVAFTGRERRVECERRSCSPGLKAKIVGAGHYAVGECICVEVPK